MTDKRPLTNDEIIARLTAEGIRATCCPECGKVKEVVDDKITFHYAPGVERVCKGSNLDMLGDVEATFERLVGNIEHATDAEEYGAMAAKEAIERLEFLFEAVEQNQRIASNQPGGEMPKVMGPSGEEFCGCTPCIVREVVLAVWPYAIHAEFTHVMELVMAEANRRDVPPSHRVAAQSLAEKIVADHDSMDQQDTA